MRNNAIVPYILIMAFGIGLIFFLSLEGVNNQADIAEENGEEENGDAAAGEGEGEGNGDEASADEFDPEALAQQNCISCHGSSYEGGMGPSLLGLDTPQDEIEDILLNGVGAMPGGLVPEENVSEMAEWVLSLEE